MLRAGLILYLGLATVFGPLLCCCNLRQVATTPQECGSCCCHATEVAEPLPSSPSQERDDHCCPCGKRHAQLLASVAVEGSVAWTIEGPTSLGLCFDAPLPPAMSLDAECAWSNSFVRPVGLWGQALLRAYQIRRC